MHRKLISLKNQHGQCHKDLLHGLSSCFDSFAGPQSQQIPDHAVMQLHFQYGVRPSLSLHWWACISRAVYWRCVSKPDYISIQRPLVTVAVVRTASLQNGSQAISLQKNLPTFLPEIFSLKQARRFLHRGPPSWSGSCWESWSALPVKIRMNGWENKWTVFNSVKHFEFAASQSSTCFVKVCELEEG